MPVSERAAVPSAASPSPELDPLLRDLVDKKVSLKRNVASLAAELKDARNKLASQEQLFAQESETRKVAESKARRMEEEVSKLQKCLEVKDEQLCASLCGTEQYLHELDGLRSQLSITQATAEASAASAKLAWLQCLSLLQNHDRHTSLNEYEFGVNKVGEQLDLQRYLEGRELSQRQLKDVTLGTETEIMDANAKAGNIIKGLESQLEKHRRIDQELKKKVLKLEFCIQKSRSQMRKLQRVGLRVENVFRLLEKQEKMIMMGEKNETGEKRDKALKELRKKVAVKQPGCGSDKQNIWENSCFKLIASMSMLALVMLAKR